MRDAINARIGPVRGVHVGRGRHVDLDDGSLRGYATSHCDIRDVPPGRGAGPQALLVVADVTIALIDGETLPVVGRLDFSAATREEPERFRPDPPPRPAETSGPTRTP